MYYLSTRNNNIKVSSMQAIAQGISKDSGLFVPEHFPCYSFDTLKDFSKLNYKDLAVKIFSDFLPDFSSDSLQDCVNKAYTADKFGADEPVKCIDLVNTNTSILELWHGPTAAFKDMALQILPHFLSNSLKKVSNGKTAVILTATSGDTGKAALEGFKNAENIKIMVFYPEDGVSNMQKLQMQTQDGDNVYVCAVKGNFDDVQTSIKKIFTDSDCNQKLSQNNMMFSSANSINWGRLLPQVIYYFYSYCDLIRKGKITKESEKVNIVVPTGNFGNILSAYYAGKMGLPINKLICASNSNNVLTDFINTGIYNKNRKFYMTMSPSMDILVSSNLERLIYDLTDGDDKKVARWMTELSENGQYEVDKEIKDKLQDLFFADFSTEEDTKNTIKTIFDKYNYLSDTHTAVALDVYNKYLNKTGDYDTNTIIASTASPYKFSKDVILALNETAADGCLDDFDIIDKLSKITNTQIVKPIASLKGKKPVFKDSCQKEALKTVVLNNLNIKE